MPENTTAPSILLPANPGQPPSTLTESEKLERTLAAINNTTRNGYQQLKTAFAQIAQQIAQNPHGLSREQVNTALGESGQAKVAGFGKIVLQALVDAAKADGVATTDPWFKSAQVKPWFAALGVADPNVL